ncbi:MAG: S26 family signal peptidase [Bacteroidales bacterium]|nr:S26 family signal peptidase [Bacteroidales bacterium]
MSKLFSNKDFLEPADSRNRSRARMIDMFIVIVIALIITNLDSLDGVYKLSIILGYILVINPILISLGGSVGHMMTNLKVRHYDDYSKSVKLPAVYYRLLLLFINNWIGFLSIKFKKDRKYLFEKLSKTVIVQLREDIPDEDVKEYNNEIARKNFAVAAILYIAFVIWLGNYWFLFGLGVVFDVYISKKVNWTPWKKRHGTNSKLVEWLDALIFAVVAVTLINIFFFQNYKIPTASMENSLLIGDHLFVSKLAYGPRVPNTPISFPFAQNTMPISKGKSYVEWIKLPYKRLLGLQKIKRNDVVVFNCPALDTVSLDNPTFSYNSDLWGMAEMMRNTDQQTGSKPKDRSYYLRQAHDYIKMKTEIISRPVDKRDNYIKRCVGMPGDTLKVYDSKLYINGKPEENTDRLLHRYLVKTHGNTINRKILERLDIAPNHVLNNTDGYEMHLDPNQAREIAKLGIVDTIFPVVAFLPEYFNQTYPNHPYYGWTIDFFGPVYIPKQGVTIQLDTLILPIYSRVINAYEGNDLLVRNDSIFINGEYTTSYTFKMNYYFMMGDNRHSSWDSRNWGFVPEDHIVGKPRFVWLSLDENKTFVSKIRWDRFFKGIH